MSSTYRPWPVMNAASSLRRTRAPIPLPVSDGAGSGGGSCGDSPWKLVSSAADTAGHLLHETLRAADDAARLGSGLHGRDDVLVAGAAAEVPLQPLADLLLGRVRVLLQEADRRHDHPRCAEAALQAVLLVEGALDGVQLAVLHERLDRLHVAPVRLE